MNRYSLEARFYPAVVILFPLLVLGVVFSVDIQKYYHILSSIGVTSVLSIFVANITRQIGKLKEEKLWNDWGGAPSTQLLRLSDTRVDAATKKRYHEKMIGLVPETLEYLQNDRQEVKDNAYKAWTKYLIVKTRDTKKYKLLFEENIHYGFRRNLWAMKSIAVIINIIAIIINTSYLVKIRELMFLSGVPFIISDIALVVLLLLWMLIINKEWVKTQAFSYADRLIEAIDQI